MKKTFKVRLYRSSETDVRNIEILENETFDDFLRKASMLFGESVGVLKEGFLEELNGENSAIEELKKRTRASEYEVSFIALPSQPKTKSPPRRKVDEEGRAKLSGLKRIYSYQNQNVDNLRRQLIEQKRIGRELKLQLGDAYMSTEKAFKEQGKHIQHQEEVLNELEKSESSAIKDMTKFERQCEGLKEENEYLMQQIHLLIDENDSLRNRVGNLEREVENLKREVGTGKREVGTVKEENRSLKDQMNSILDRLSKIEEKQKD